MRAIFMGDKKSLLTQHSIQNNQEFDLNGVKIFMRLWIL